MIWPELLLLLMTFVGGIRIGVILKEWVDECNSDRSVERHE